MKIKKINYLNPVAPLFNTAQAKTLYIFKALFISVIPAILISSCLVWLFPETEQPSFAEDGMIGFFFGAVFLGPIAETFVLWGGISFIRLFVSSTWKIALVSASVWAVLHSSSAAMWGMVIFWSFVVFSISFIEWAKVSTRDALLVTAAIHMCQNFLVFLVLQFG